VPYLGQFDNLVRDRDRGHAIGFTRTIVVFTDGLAVCPVPVPGGGSLLQPGMLSQLLRVRRPAVRVSPQQIRDVAVAMGAGGTAGGFAAAWRGADAIPFAVLERIVLARPQQVSRLEIYLAGDGTDGTDLTVYLGDLSPDEVRSLLGPLLGDRLQIDV
jgi:hypothetical protein